MLALEKGGGGWMAILGMLRHCAGSRADRQTRRSMGKETEPERPCESLRDATPAGHTDGDVMAWHGLRGGRGSASAAMRKDRSRMRSRDGGAGTSMATEAQSVGCWCTVNSGPGAPPVREHTLRPLSAARDGTIRARPRARTPAGQSPSPRPARHAPSPPPRPADERRSARR